MKRAQITLFILIGVAVLVFFGIVLMKPGHVSTTASEYAGDAGRVAYTKDSLHSYVDDCLKDIALEAVDELGIESVENIRRYIDSNIGTCIDTDALASQGITVNTGNPKSQVSFGSDDMAMVIEAQIPITIPLKDGEKSEMDEFRFSMDIEKKTPLNIDAGGFVQDEYKIKSGDRDLELIIPEGIVAKDPSGNVITDVKMKIIPNDDVGVVGTVQYELTPHLEFSEPVDLVFDFSSEENIDLDQMTVVYLSNGIWRAVDTDIDSVKKTATGHVDHFSTFALHGKCGVEGNYTYWDTLNFAQGQYSTEDKTSSGKAEFHWQFVNQPSQKVCIRNFELIDVFMNDYDMARYDPITANVGKWKPDILLGKFGFRPIADPDIFGRCISPGVSDEGYQKYLSSVNDQYMDYYYDFYSYYENIGQLPLYSFDLELTHTLPDAIVEKVLYYGVWLSCNGYCDQQSDVAACLAEPCPYTEFDWIARFAFKLNGNFEAVSVDEGITDYLPYVFFSQGNEITGNYDEYMDQEFYRLRESGEVYPFVPPAEIDGNIVFRDASCSGECGDGIVDYDEVCDNAAKPPWGEGRLHYCLDDMHLSKCNDDCSGYVDQEVCWFGEYCSLTAIECDGLRDGDACTTSHGYEGICTGCRCIPETCGDGKTKELDGTPQVGEVCDPAISISIDDPVKYRCADNKYMEQCRYDCSGYEKMDLCFYNEYIGCTGGDPECNLAVPGGTEPVGEGESFGYCDENCLFTPETCGDGIKQDNEVCDNSPDLPWLEDGKEGGMYFCDEHGIKYVCNSDCTGYESTELCTYDPEHGCNAGIACDDKGIGDRCSIRNEEYYCDNDCQCGYLCGNGVLDEGEECDYWLIDDTKNGPIGCYDSMGVAFQCTDECYYDTTSPICSSLCGGDEKCDGYIVSGPNSVYENPDSIWKHRCNDWCEYKGQIFIINYLGLSGSGCYSGDTNTLYIDYEGAGAHGINLHVYRKRALLPDELTHSEDFTLGTMSPDEWITISGMVPPDSMFDKKNTYYAEIKYMRQDGLDSEPYLETMKSNEIVVENCW